MINIKNLTMRFKNKEVLNNVNIKLEKGKIYGFIGRNGCGKTVLFKIICGLLTPTSGEVYFDNKKIGKDIDFPEDCGVIIENPGFLYGLSGFKNLKLLASINNKIGDKEIRESMELVGLDSESNIKVKGYSLGMKQKLAIAQAIMEKPKVLILDEPMNSLDEESVSRIRDILFDLKNKGITILISSHIKEDIEILSDEVYKVENKTVNKIIERQN